MKARAHDGVELAQALDDHRVLLFDHVEQIARNQADDKDDNRQPHEPTQKIEDKHDRSLERIAEMDA